MGSPIAGRFRPCYRGSPPQEATAGEPRGRRERRTRSAGQDLLLVRQDLPLVGLDLPLVGQDPVQLGLVGEDRLLIREDRLLVLQDRPLVRGGGVCHRDPPRSVVSTTVTSSRTAVATTGPGGRRRAPAAGPAGPAHRGTRSGPWARP